jgi:hypothetical protein
MLPYFSRWAYTELRPLLAKLVDQGKVVIWRDTAPGGDALQHHSNPDFSYYSNFQWQNQIMHELMRQIGGYYLPIFKPSQTKWTQHIGMSQAHKEGNDLLHWCQFEPESVPSMWNHLLYALLLEKLR